MGILISLGLMAGLKAFNDGFGLIVWLIIGMVMYFTYSVKHSHVRNTDQT